MSWWYQWFMPAPIITIERPLVFSAFAAVALALSFWSTPEGLPSFEVCTFKSFTGLPCPGCGLTRGFCAVSHGRFRDASAFHAFSLPLYALNLGLLFSPLLLRRFPDLASPASQRFLFRAAGALAAAIIAYGLWRIIHLWGHP